jgi:hypothetical protein
MRQIIMMTLSLSLMATHVLAQNSPPVGKVEKRKNLDPNAAQIVTSDIDLFWKAYDLVKPENDLIVFRDQYLRKGSIGLKEFTRARISSSCALVDAIEKHPKYYASLRERSLKADSYEDSIRASFRKLKELYNGAVFPDVYFLIGRLNSAGTLTEEGLFIGVDMFGRSPSTPVEELSDWHKAVIKPIEDIPFLVAHELIHYQQKYPKGEPTLLATAIGEGSADFIGELISGKTSTDHLHKYGNSRERELWAKFKQQMDGKDVSNWLYQGDQAKDRPADLGYYIGYKICESYYKQATDKKQAIKDILEIQDFKQFLKASKYERKFD